jgi:hypothetical protein
MLRTRMFSGALYAGALFGPTEDTPVVAPPVRSYGGGLVFRPLSTILSAEDEEQVAVLVVVQAAWLFYE